MSEPNAGTEMAGDIPYEEPTLDSFREGGQCNCHVCLNIRRDGFLKRAARLSPASITDAVAGWKLVPVEPTQEMLDAVTAADQAPPWNDEIMTVVYHDMLEAAPAHPIPGEAGPTEDTLGYATRLLVSLMHKHCPDRSPQWEPLPDLMGVLTQLDNLSTCLVRAPIGETGDTDELVETMAYAVRFGLGNDEWFLFRLDELSTAQKRSAKWNSPVEALVPLSALGQYSTQLEAALAAEKQRADRHEQNAVETQMLAFKWMEAHDKRAAGKPYDLPTVADVPNTIARVAALEGALNHVHNWIANTYWGPDELVEAQTIDNIVLEAINYAEAPFDAALAPVTTPPATKEKPE